RTRITDLEQNLHALEELRKAERAEQERAHEAALAGLRERIVAVETADEARRAHGDSTRSREHAELEAKWEARVAEAAEQARRETRALLTAEMQLLEDQVSRTEQDYSELKVAFDRTTESLSFASEKLEDEVPTERPKPADDSVTNLHRIEALEAL